MTIRIIEQDDEFIINHAGREFRLEKPATLEDAKAAAREHFGAIGKKVNWRLF